MTSCVGVELGSRLVGIGESIVPNGHLDDGLGEGGYGEEEGGGSFALFPMHCRGRTGRVARPTNCRGGRRQGQGSSLSRGIGEGRAGWSSVIPLTCAGLGSAGRTELEWGITNSRPSGLSAKEACCSVLG